MLRFPNFVLLFASCLCLSIPPELSAQEDELSNTPELDQEYFKILVDSSNAYYVRGNYKQSLGVNIFLLKKALDKNHPKYIHMGYRHLGYDYLAMNDTLMAEECFDKSQTYAKKAKNDTATALAYMDLANLYSTLKQDHQEALEYHDKSIKLFEKIKDSAGLAKAHYNTIMTAMEANEFNTAFLHLIKAKKLIEKGNNSSYSIGIDILFGEYYLKKENYEMADIYLTRSIENAKLENLGVELEAAYDDYSESLFKQERYSEAFEARKEYEKYLRSGLLKIASSEAEAMSAKFQVAEYRKDMKEAELVNQLQAQRVANKSRLNNFLIVVSVIGLSLLIILYLAYRKRKQLVLQLKVKNQEYLEAKEHSEKLSKSKSNFFSTVSHELRTPLYGVIGLSTILLEDESLKTHEKDLKSLKFSADYLLALINDVLHINKIDSDKLDDELTAFNVRELLETIASSFEYMRIQNRNTINIDVSPQVPALLKGNPIRLSQILMNLVGNAMKFTEEGYITIGALLNYRSDGEVSVEFSVQDTGIGIAKEKQDIIYDEFSQGDSLNYNYQGTGLGLPIVKKLLSSSNSKIQLESELGKGSTFKFNLIFEVAENSVEDDQHLLIDVKALNGINILIVEDNRINQIVTQKILEKNGVICSLADNGLQAVDKVSREKYDLILMDINMPLKDGIQATREIREFNTQIPIVALTAVEVEEHRYEIYDSGMDDIIVKPYDVTKFEQTILKNLAIKDGGKHLKAI